ncbi:MAG: dTMP kinase, partial [Bradymonadaceae bacterium]
QGFFVAIEGLDGAGTTTQTDLLVDRLVSAGIGAHATREPSDGPIGALIRQMLSGRIRGSVGSDEEFGRATLALLFAADRLDHLDSEVRPALREGATVVTDRYYYSSFAYQSTAGADGEPDLDWVRAVNDRARPPDLTIFLEASADLCIERMGNRVRRDVFEERSRLERLEQRYEAVVSALEREGHPVERFDADRRRRALADDIFRAVLDRRR